MNEVITEEYRAMQQELHKNPMYGMMSKQYAGLVAQVMKENKLISVSDYGAGKKRLYYSLLEEGLVDFDYFPYDPAFPEYGSAQHADLITCIDVLEHIEPDLLDNVLSDLQRLVNKYGLFSIHTGPAGKVLSDGRNAHLIQEPKEWWLTKLKKLFNIHAQADKGAGFWVVVTPKDNNNEERM
jgi:hypothetical protein